ncbi:tail fiber protein [Yersinia phage vB_YpM_MDG45]|uniref:Tail fiber protein n=2 Tax=unclassified Eganvirus TaxID=2748756 RepID=A0AAX4M7T2_9CAUD
MTAKFYAILTNQGAARLANAAALGTRLNLTQMAVGDANGKLPTPDPVQTKLINQKRIAPLNMLSIDPKNTSQIVAEQVIPENEGGWWIREIGLYDDAGVLIAVANCPETYKPLLQEGSGRTQTIRMLLIVSSTSAITLKIDPAVVLATRQYVDDKIIEVKGYADEKMRLHEQSRNHPDGTLTAKGFLQLNSSVESTSEQLAATPKAVKIAMDNANARMAKERNLADLTNPALARQNLSLGDSATKNVGKVAGTVAAGDDQRITGAVQNTRKVNGKQLSNDVVITSEDVGALPASGGKVSGILNVEKYISASGEIAVRDGDEMLSMKTLQPENGPHFVSKRTSSNVYRTHKLQDASGVLMHVGDYGWGGKGEIFNLDDDQIKARMINIDTPTQVFRNESEQSKYGWRWSVHAYFKSGNTFTALIASHAGSGVRIIGGHNAGDPFIYNMLHDRNTKINHNGQVVSTAVTELSDNPVGAPIPWPQSAVPSGFLACNGQSFNKTTYPLLASAYPSGILPDLRGEFIRGLDAGRGVDTGRTVLSAQGDAIRNIVASGLWSERGTPPTGQITGAAYMDTARGAAWWGSGQSDNDNYVMALDASRVVPVANENRPRNVAFLYIVRAA